MPFGWRWHKLFPPRRLGRHTSISGPNTGGSGLRQSPKLPPLRPRTPPQRPRKARWPVRLYRVHKGKPDRCNFIQAIRYALEVHNRYRLRQRQLEDGAADLESIERVISSLRAHRRSSEANPSPSNSEEAQNPSKQITTLERLHKKRAYEFEISAITARRTEASKAACEEDLLDAIKELLETRPSHIDGVRFSEELGRSLWQVVAPREYFEELQRLRPVVQYLRTVQEPYHDPSMVELALIVARVDELESMRPAIQDRARNRARMDPDATNSDDEPHASVVDDPFEDYKMGRQVIAWSRTRHDDREHDVDEVYNAFRAEHSDAPIEQWTQHWLQHRREEACQDLAGLQDAFCKDRNRALRLGAQPLEVENDGDWDIPGFGGVHPEDGKTESEAPDVPQARRDRGVQLGPSIDGWMCYGVDDLDARLESISPEMDLSGIAAGEIEPWESFSSCQPRTGMARRMRRRREEMENRAVQDVLSLMTGELLS
ncbi:hypothetical protein EJ03DRAFT_350375 [Teratosphaeria nubilosa]|uniref:Uncharacterized protein n=1 Tax=Teratosphaeria nubilosa TaxID=161662 RepID=A0A6G1LD85_9PEZI|nr:hypothetical protein EJ03DRAFT_350375 [Teratosphaeria nubilosa]